MEEILGPLEARVLSVLESTTGSTTVEHIMCETNSPRIAVELAIQVLAERGFIAISSEIQVDPEVMRFSEAHPLAEMPREWMVGYCYFWKFRHSEARLPAFGDHIENVMLAARMVGSEQAILLIAAHFSLKVEDIVAALLRADAESLWNSPSFAEVEAMLMKTPHAFAEIQDMIASLMGNPCID